MALSLLVIVAAALLAAADRPRGERFVAGPLKGGDRAEGGVAGACDGDAFTQSVAPFLIQGESSLACGSQVTTLATSLARSFPPPPEIAVGCVTFGVDINTGGPWPVEVRLLTGTITGPYAALTLLAETTVMIPAGSVGSFHTALFPSAVTAPPGQPLIVELRVPSRHPADGGDGAALFLGCNGAGQSAPTYIRAPGCGVQNFLDTAAIGFGGSHLALTVGSSSPESADPCGAVSAGDCLLVHVGPGCSDTTCCESVCAADSYCCTMSWDGPCVALALTLCAPSSPDLNFDGIVDATDLASMLGAWGTASIADFNADGFVDAADLATLLGAWGPTTPPPPACPGSESCTDPHASPGCSDAECCTIVCAIDPSCCIGAWDAACVSIAISQCEPCCRHDLKLFNAVPGIGSIAITPVNPTAIRDVFSLEDPEDWSLTLESSGTFVIRPGVDATSPDFPVDVTEELDAEFVIDVRASQSPTMVTIEWRDLGGAVVKIETITLECPAAELVGEAIWLESYDWEGLTEYVTGLPDSDCWAGAVPVECEVFDTSDPDDDDAISAKTSASCSIQHSIACVNDINTLLLTPPPATPDVVRWEWTVDDGEGKKQYTTYPPPGDPVAKHPLIRGAYPVVVSLSVCTDDGTGVRCTTCPDQSVADICIGHPEFTASTPKAVCNGQTLSGYKVELKPTPGATACSVASFTWNFGDGSPAVSGTGIPGAINHTYPAAAGTYYTTLAITDPPSLGGCTRIATVPVTIKASCDPDFSAAYVWCAGQDQTSVEVKFTNLSQTFCGSSFVWTFGDGTTLTSSDDVVSHTYSNLQQTATTFQVTLKMIDPAKCPGPAGTSVTKAVKLVPIVASVSATACSDGQVYFIATSAPGAKIEWSLPPGCWRTEFMANLGKRRSQVTCCPDEGTHSFSATISEEIDEDTTGSCTVDSTVTVARICYPKVKVRGKSNFSIGSESYRVYWRDKIDLVKRRCSTTVTGRTAFKKKFGIFWLKIKPAHDGSISGGSQSTSFHGFRIADGSGICGCEVDTSIGNGDSLFRIRKSVAKFKEKNIGLARRGLHRDTLFRAVHTVVHHGHTFVVDVQKPAGLNCETFNFSPLPSKLRAPTQCTRCSN